MVHNESVFNLINIETNEMMFFCLYSERLSLSPYKVMFSFSPHVRARPSFLRKINDNHNSNVVVMQLLE